MEKEEEGRRRGRESRLCSGVQKFRCNIFHLHSQYRDNIPRPLKKVKHGCKSPAKAEGAFVELLGALSSRKKSLKEQRDRPGRGRPAASEILRATDEGGFRLPRSWLRSSLPLMRREWCETGR